MRYVVSRATLERWRAAALANGSGGSGQRWTAAARLQAVITTAAMDEGAHAAPGAASRGCIRRSWRLGSRTPLRVT